MPNLYPEAVISQAHSAINADGTTVATVTPPAGARKCYVTVKSNDVIMSFDGTAPSATNGLIFKKDLTAVPLPIAVVTKILAISASAATVDFLWVA